MQHTLSSVYYPAAYIFLVVCFNNISTLKEYENDNNLNITIMAMKLKWTNYFLEILSVYLVAFIFYSRFRLDDLGVYLTIYYESLRVHIDIDDKIRDVKKLVNNLYDYYSANYCREHHTFETSKSTN